MLRRYVDYEPPWRYYNIVQSSTKLLFTHKIDIITYIIPLLHWGKGILLVDGPRKLIKSFGLGIIHALLDKLGYRLKIFIVELLIFHESYPRA
jgi:hypothetical protein